MLFIPDCINVLIMTPTDISFYFKYNCESQTVKILELEYLYEYATLYINLPSWGSCQQRVNNRFVIINLVYP